MRGYTKANLTGIVDKRLRRAFEHHDTALADLSVAVAQAVGGAVGSDESPVVSGPSGDAGQASAVGKSLLGQSYAVIATDPTLINERVLTAGTGVTLTDAGAKGALTIAQSAASMGQLVSASSVTGDTLTLTSDGADFTLTPSRSGADIIIADQAANALLRLYSGGGAWVQGHSLFGKGDGVIAGPQVGYTVAIAEPESTGAWTTALYVSPTLDADMAALDRTGGFYDMFLADGYDPDAGGTSTTVIAHRVSIGGTVSGSALVGSNSKTAGIDITINPTIPAASAQWTDLIGVNINAIQIGGTAPLRSYGLKVANPGNGTTKWAAAFGGFVQMSGVQKLGFGNNFATTQSVNSLRCKTATGVILVMELNSADEYEWSATAFYPVTNGANTLGQNGNGWGSLLLKDTAAAFETTLQVTNTGIGADNVLTLDLGNTSRTVTLSGNPTLADWFDQNVKTTGTPQFARAGVGQAANGTVLFAVNDATTAPTSNVSTGVVSRYGGDSTFCGDPNSWLRIRVGATTYKIPLFA